MNTLYHILKKNQDIAPKRSSVWLQAVRLGIMMPALCLVFLFFSASAAEAEEVISSITTGPSFYLTGSHSGTLSPGRGDADVGIFLIHTSAGQYDGHTAFQSAIESSFSWGGRTITDGCYAMSTYDYAYGYPGGKGRWSEFIVCQGAEDDTYTVSVPQNMDMKVIYLDTTDDILYGLYANYFYGTSTSITKTHYVNIVDPGDNELYMVVPYPDKYYYNFHTGVSVYGDASLLYHTVGTDMYFGYYDANGVDAEIDVEIVSQPQNVFGIYLSFDAPLPPPDPIPPVFQSYYLVPSYEDVEIDFTYRTDIFTEYNSGDYIDIYQCAGEDYDVPDCSTSSLTYIDRFDVVSDRDQQYYRVTGNGYITLYSTSSAYKTYAAVAHSHLYSEDFPTQYFGVQFYMVDPTVPDQPYEYDQDDWCADPCDGIATTTFGGEIACGMRRLLCWAFEPTEGATSYIGEAAGKIKAKFPANVYFDVTDALVQLSTTTDNFTGIRLPVPDEDAEGHATITMEELITSSTFKNAIGSSNYDAIRQAIIWLAWIIAIIIIIAQLRV